MSTPILDTAYFASGCFWGTEYHFLRAKGVVSCKSGYMGGTLINPTYEDVCQGDTGHVETVKVEFDPMHTSYETLLRLYFETHNFTQTTGQGPDIGSQYLSVIFPTSEAQKQIAEHYIELLKEKGYSVATSIVPAEEHLFWQAEDYHQHYYNKRGGRPYCHVYKKVF